MENEKQIKTFNYLFTKRELKELLQNIENDYKEMKKYNPSLCETKKAPLSKTLVVIFEPKKNTDFLKIKEVL